MSEWIERAMRKTTISEKGGCWLYDYDLTKNGYGRIIVGEERVRIHRLSYSTFRGPVPGDLLVCHSCDVRNCWNPDHLFLGTSKDNAQDAISKGRFHFFPADKRAPKFKMKISIGDAQTLVEMYATGVSKPDLARHFGISESQVKKIIYGECWPTVDRSSLRKIRNPEPQVSSP